MMSPQFQIQAAQQEIEFEAKRKLETALTRHRIGDSRSDGTIFGFVRARYQGAEYGDPFRDYDWAGLFELFADHALEPTNEKAVKLLAEIRKLRRGGTRASETLAEAAKSFETLETVLTKVNAQIHEELAAAGKEKK